MERPPQKIRVWLVGSVAHRPRTLNPVGTQVMRKRSIPVMLGDVLVGVAVAEQYPDLDSGAAVFEAELEVARVPPSWAGKRVPLLRVEQSKSWPGPFPLRIFVSPDAQRS